jgi:molybdopterin/thiamine biosynthesis adenylyltransferase
MEDHHNLKQYYEFIRNESVEYLIDRYNCKVIEDVEDKNKYPITVKSKVNVAEIKIDIHISLPFNYPDSFPRIRIAQNSFKEIYPLPHLSQDGILCVFDDVLASPNPKEPKGVLDSTYRKTVELLTNGINGVNKFDYAEEFESYWFEESKDNYLNLVQPDNYMKEVFLVPFKFKSWPYEGIISESKSEGIKWIQNIQGEVLEEKLTKLLYVPLKTLPSYPYPKNNKDVYQLMKNQNVNTLSYMNFLTNSKRPTKILFSVKGPNSYTWGIWEHKKPFAIDISLYKGKKNVRTELKGFRKGRQNGLLEITRDFPEVEINKHSVVDVRNERLAFRGGDGNTTNNKLKVAVIGCGAIGSHLIQSLVDINVEELLIIDPDILSFDNVKRHFCGVKDVGMYKTKAIRKKLLNLYPSLNIHTSEMNVLELITLYPNVLNNYDYIFAAISDFPTEQRLRSLQLNNSLNRPLFILWVEPYMAGGHVVNFSPDSKTDYWDLFNDKGEYKYHVLKNGNQYALKELGCNTTFVPYGILELKKFILEFITEFEYTTGSYSQGDQIYVWMGNLKEQRINNRLISGRWVGAKNYSIRKITV